jgi:hypothetical protein
MFPWGLGVDFVFGGFGLPPLGPTHLRRDLFLFFPWFLGVLLSGRDGYHIFKDLEAETIHVCIAWALLQYLGLFFMSVAPSSFIAYSLVMVLFFPVHRFGDG